MGLRLQNTAYSVNIKERLDFSCALFDALGQLIANAPHMPVHLGSMSESDQDGDRAQPADARGRRLRAERSVPRRHAPARRDRGDAGVPESDRRQAELLRGLARPPRRHRRLDAGLDAAVLEDHRRRRRAVRQLPAGARRAPARARAARATADHELAGAQSRSNDRRPARTDRRQREGRAGAAVDGGSVRPRDGRGLHEARAGQRRGVGATRDHRAEGWRLPTGARQRRAHPGQGDRAREANARRRSTSPAPARSWPTTSTRPRR